MRAINTIYETCVGNAILMLQIDYAEYRDSRCERAVDARVLVVGWMTGWGVSEAELCRLTGWKQQRVNYLKNLAVVRLHRRLFRLRYEALTRAMNEGMMG